VLLLPWAWGPKEVEAFKNLKKAMISAPVLKQPDFDEPFILMTDASGYGAGAILGQADKTTAKVHPVAFGSWLFSPSRS